MAVKDFFDNLKGGARWDVGVSINRSNSLPLDANSVFDSLDAAQKYAAGTPAEGTLANAYPGQLLAVVTEAETIVYYIDANMTLQPVGNTKEIMEYLGEIPETSDAKTIIEYINKKTEGIATSASLAQLQRDVDAVEAIVGTEATDTEGATGLVKAVADNAQAIADEVSAREAAIGVKASEGVEASGVYADIAAALQEAKDYADAQDADTVYDDTELSGRVSTLETNSATKEELKAVEDKIPTVPTNVSAFSNDAGYLTAIPEEYVTDSELTAKGYQTATDVETIVDAAIAEINHAVFEKVDAVPAAADAVANVLYLVPNDDKLDIYAKIGEEMVLIDDTDADLSGYAKTEDVNAELAKKLDITTYEAKIAELEAALAKKVESSVYDAKVQEIDGALAEKLVASDLADYAKSADVVAKTDYEQKVQEIEGSLDNKLESDDLADYAKTADINGKLDLKANADDVYTKGDVDTKIGTPAVLDEEGNVTTEGTGVYANTYTRRQIEELIADITGGESAADVLAALNTYKGENNARVDAIELALNGSDTEDGIVDIVAGHTTQIANLVAKDNELAGLIEANDADIAAIQAILNDTTDAEGATVLGLISKVDALAGAQANVIEGIKFNGETMTVGEDKVVEINYNLPIADADTLGGVKSDAGANKVAIAEDGTMEVNSINVNKLVQDENDTIILNGGNAN